MTATPLVPPVQSSRFTLSALTLTLLTAFLALALVAGCQAIRYLHEQERQTQILSLTVAANLIPAINANQVDRAEAVLNTLQADPSIVAASVYDQKGDIVVSYRRENHHDLLPEKALPPLLIGSTHAVEAFVEITELSNKESGNEVLGTLYLKKHLNWKRAFLPWILPALLLLAGAFVLGLLGENFAAPASSGSGEPDLSDLNELTAFMRSLAKQHDFQLRAPVRRRNEVGRVAEALNELLSQIALREQEQAAARQKTGAAPRLAPTTAEKGGPKHSAPLLSHLRRELEAPLRGLLEETRALKFQQRDLAEPQRHRLRAIERHGNYLLTVLDDAAEAAPAKPAPFDLADLLEQLTSVFKLRAAAQEIGFDFELVGALPKKVTGDLRHIRQVVRGLVSNALHFTTKGRVDLTVGLLNDRIRFEVRDTGSPIDPTHPAIDPRFHEAGIGLAALQGEVTHLGSTLKFRTADGTNITWFDLSLPAS